MTSILLMLLFSFPLIAPLFASTSDADLPVCCRKNGAHHCLGMGMMMQTSQDKPSIRALCPYYPHTSMTMQMQQVFIRHPQSRFAQIVAHPSGKPQTEARYRIAFSRSRQKRGPPVISL